MTPFGRFHKQWLRCRAAECFMLVCSASACTNADEVANASAGAHLDIAQLISSMGHISTAGVVFIPPGTSLGHNLSSDQLLKQGCNFKSSNPKLISELIDALEKVDFKADQHALEWDKREAIFLRSDAGFELRIVFGDTYNGYWGDIEQTGKNSHQTVIVRPPIAKGIYRWAARVPLTSMLSPDADMAKDCRDSAK